MKINNVECRILSVPLRRDMNCARNAFKLIDWVVLKVQTDECVEGLGYALCFGRETGMGSRAIKSVLETEFANLIIGEDPFMSQKIKKKLLDRSYYFGHVGLTRWAMALIDMALWDIIAKCCNKPLYKLLGGFRQEVPAYASGIDLSWDLPELLKEVEEFVTNGFQAVKIKVGRSDWREDINRVKNVRKVVGDNIKVMVDANQQWRPHEAIRIGKALEQFNVYWLEDPVTRYDLQGIRNVTNTLKIPIAAGEQEFMQSDFRNLIVEGGVQIIQPDIMRCGGVSEAIKIASLADTWNLFVAPHLYPEVMCHIIAAIPNGLMVEHVPIVVDNFNKIFNNPHTIKNGKYMLSDKPGHGIEIKEEAIKN